MTCVMKHWLLGVIDRRQVQDTAPTMSQRSRGHHWSSVLGEPIQNLMHGLSRCTDQYSITTMSVISTAQDVHGAMTLLTN